MALLAWGVLTGLLVQKWLSQLVSHGVRSCPAGVKAFGWDCRGQRMVLLSFGCAALLASQGQKFFHMYKPHSDHTTHRSRAVCIGTPTNGVNIVPPMAASVGVPGGRAREGKMLCWAQEAGRFQNKYASPFFFHEYGRRVGMVPRSSLKGGKNSLMVEKGTEKPNTKPNKQNTTTQGPQAASPPSCSLSSVQGETCETRVSV